MTLQIVFINCPVIDALKHIDRRVHQINTSDILSELYSPRWKRMLGENYVHINNSRVAYIHWYNDGEKSRYDDIYDFIFDCRCNSSNKNYFILECKSVVENTPIEELLTKGERYIPVSGERLPRAKSPHVKAYLLQACHILSLWKVRNLLASAKKTITVANTRMEVDQSLGNHLILDKREGWIFNTSTYIIALLIDYYEIEGELPNAQLNFSNDAEYRFKVASYLFNVLRALCVNNGRTSVSSEVEDVIRTVIDIVR
jgi:hypothetical protein